MRCGRNEWKAAISKLAKRANDRKGSQAAGPLRQEWVETNTRHRPLIKCTGGRVALRCSGGRRKRRFAPSREDSERDARENRRDHEGCALDVGCEERDHEPSVEDKSYHRQPAGTQSRGRAAAIQVQ